MIIKSNLKSAGAVISCQELGKNYHPRFNHTVRGLSDCDLEIQAGEFWGIFGLNGSGKTTLLNLITGTLNPTLGRVMVFGFDLAKHRLSTAKHMYYMHQDDIISSRSSLYDELMTYMQLYGYSVNEARTALADQFVRLNISQYRTMSLKDLSGGTKRRFSLALAFAINPDILILDEPFNGLDTINKQIAIDYILDLYKKGTTVITTTHIVEDSFHKELTHLAILSDARIIKKGPINEFIDAIQSVTYSITLSPKSVHTIKRDLFGSNVTIDENGTIELTINRKDDLMEQLNHLRSLGAVIMEVSPVVNKMESIIKHFTQA